MSRRFLSHLSYVGVGLASLLLAVFVATKVVSPAYSQDTPAEEAPAVEAAPPNAEVATEAPPAEAPPAEAPAAETPAVETPAVETPAVEAQAPAPDAIVANPGTAEGAAEISGDVSFLEPYVFDIRDGRRNPFRMPMAIENGNMDVVLPGTPLERYDLDELKLAGIMWDIRTPKAMVIDPQGEVHILGKDDRIGRKRGYVATIREGEVVVVETSTFNGENTYSTRILRIDK